MEIIPKTLSKIFKNPESVKFTKIDGGRTRDTYYVNGKGTPKVFKAQPNPGWHKLVENREVAIKERRLLIHHYTEIFNGKDTNIELLPSKFNIIEKTNENGDKESVIITIEEPRFDIYPGVKNDFIDLCCNETSGFGNVNGDTLENIVKNNETFRSDLTDFLNIIRSTVKYKEAFNRNGEVIQEDITLILDFYGLSNLLYKDSKFIINNSAFKFDYNGIPISTRTVHYILKNLEKTKIPTENQKYILRLSLVCMEWINKLCKLCEISNIYKEKTLSEIGRYSCFF